MGTMNLGEVNWLAVLVAAFGTFMIGGAWYTVLFGKAWQRAHGYSDEQVKQIQATKPPAIFFGSMLVCYFIVALGLALAAQLAGANSLAQGATLGLIVWIIVAAVGWTNHIPTNVANSGYFIDVSYQLIYLVGTGAVICAWQ